MALIFTLQNAQLKVDELKEALTTAEAQDKAELQQQVDAAEQQLQQAVAEKEQLSAQKQQVINAQLDQISDLRHSRSQRGAKARGKAVIQQLVAQLQAVQEQHNSNEVEGLLQKLEAAKQLDLHEQCRELEELDQQVHELVKVALRYTQPNTPIPPPFDSLSQANAYLDNVYTAAGVQRKEAGGGGDCALLACKYFLPGNTEDPTAIRAAIAPTVPDPEDRVRILGPGTMDTGETT